ncbi:MAG: pyridoxal-phosphate dependent enzyme [Anaerolineales bacterium]|nr:pyridoxal-phosphate dependent enzyme [Anaerolineales bacterium]
MIDLRIDKKQLKRTVERAKERNIIIPTFAQMKNPDLIPDSVKEELKKISLWDITARNLFRITWKNEPVVDGGGYGGVNYVELPSSLTGVDARIIALVGKWFPTGAHKVGATFGCLVPPLITGQFDPTYHQAVWPSTGNYCRGGAYDASLLSCESIAILPEGMSRERFDWLANVAGEVIATPGSESNVKEIYDKVWELRETRDNIFVFNQFDEFGNYLWHYDITGHAMEEVLQEVMGPNDEYQGLTLTTGSAGTLGCGDYMKQLYPSSKVVAGEALQCPTLLENGFGAHRIEGIGDKHVPWIHNMKNTDMIMAIDDNTVVNLARLFNEPAGRKYLVDHGVPEDLVGKLDLLGFSSIANTVMAIKMAKYYEMDANDVILTVWTDSMELYESRLKEMHEEFGEYTEMDAARTSSRYLEGLSPNYLQELTYEDQRRVHNLKYFTWIEQQGKTYEEIQSQWYDKDYWTNFQEQIPEVDELINEFNDKVGLI